jgi:dimethylargininase
MATLALTRAVSPSLAECALSFLDRVSIDVSLAQRQHERYEECLRELGVEVRSLPAEADLPDSVFVEDTTVVTDEVAVMTAPRLDSRRREVASMAAVLSEYRPQEWIEGTATLEGGDVLRIGRTIYVGLSARTNREGAEQLARYLEPHGYSVRPTIFSGCLHLKTACTYVGQGIVLANTSYVDTDQFEGLDVLAVPPEEPMGGNALLIGDTVVIPASLPGTRALLEAHGITVAAVDVSELEKAEAGVTCCSVLLEV